MSAATGQGSGGAAVVPYKATGSGALALPMNTMSEIAKAGELLAQSQLFGALNPAAGFVIAATCHQQGISLMEFQRTYHIVEGRPSMRADAMLAEFRKRGGKVRILKNTMDEAAAEFDFEGQKVVFAYTMDDARRTGDCFKIDGKTLKHTWAKRPDDMLWARLISRAVRRLCPEINAGLYAPEEVADFDGAAPSAPMRQVRLAPEAVRERTAAQAQAPSEAEPLPPAPEIVEPEVVSDPYVCPMIGSSCDGQRWECIETERLTAALHCDLPEITEAHREAIRDILNARGGAA